MTDLPEKETENNNLKTLLKPIAAVLFAAALIFTLFNLLYIEVPKTAFAFELGDRIETDASYYLSGGALALKIARTDFSEVDMSRPGIYQMKIRYFWFSFPFEIAIADTTSPDIIPLDGPLYFLQGTELQPSDFVASIVDADKNVKVSFNTDLMERSSLNCSFLGTYSAWITATDTSGNTSRCIVDYIVDIPPEFCEPRDIYVALDSDESILDCITATDLMDGDISDKIRISEDIDSISEKTDISVIFSVEDSCGFESSTEMTVHLDTAEAIQELIGSGEISRSSAYIAGAINIYDTGLLRGQNIEDTMIDVIPTVTDVRIPERNGSITTGSGFIIEITDKDIFIVTNKHVVKSNTECEIYFYTGDSAIGKIIGTDSDYDVAVVRVSLSDLPESFEDFISTVHIDMTYWSRLDSEPVELAIEKMNTDGTIQHYTYGTLIRRLQRFEYFTPHIQTEMSLTLRPGDSGSAVFDKEGRLIGMAFAYSISPERDWAVPLNEIVDAYEEITGRELYTY